MKDSIGVMQHTRHSPVVSKMGGSFINTPCYIGATLHFHSMFCKICNLLFGITLLVIVFPCYITDSSCVVVKWHVAAIRMCTHVCMYGCSVHTYVV